MFPSLLLDIQKGGFFRRSEICIKFPRYSLLMSGLNYYATIDTNVCVYNNVQCLDFCTLNTHRHGIFVVVKVNAYRLSTYSCLTYLLWQNLCIISAVGIKWKFFYIEICSTSTIICYARVKFEEVMTICARNFLHQLEIKSSTEQLEQ